MNYSSFHSLYTLCSIMLLLNDYFLLCGILDNNECSLGSHNCEQVCDNIDGGFLCSCYDGFNLTENRHSCEIVGESPSALGAASTLPWLLILIVQNSCIYIYRN